MKIKDQETLVLTLCAAFDRIAECEAYCKSHRKMSDRSLAKELTFDTLAPILAPTLPILEERRPQWAALRLAALVPEVKEVGK